MEDPTRREFLAVASVTVAAMSEGAGPVDLEAPPAWVRGVTRMSFGTPGEVEKVARVGAEVLHTNLVWPYFPLRREGGGLNDADRKALRTLAADCKKHRLRLAIGLPPFMPVELARKHPDWREHPDDAGVAVRRPPDEKDLGTRAGCNLGPWGDHLIEVCAELVEDFGVDAFSFDGNYHPRVCYCPACKKAYRQDARRDIPAKVDLKEVAYREYLVWRGQRLIDHYRGLRTRLRKANPEAAVVTWTVNAGRYGHFLHSPRAMPVALNRVFDLPMQEWWHDETNLGASVAPAFGAAYLRAVAGDRPCASEPYLMSRGNPYGTDSFPALERRARGLLALTHGNVAAHSVGWPGHIDSARQTFEDVTRRARWLPDARPVPWAALLVSEQTRQFYAFENVAERFLPHVFGVFRAALEEHLPLTLLTDDDITARGLAGHRVLILANAAALSDAQCDAVRRFVEGGGGLVATAEASLCDELGRPRHDFALRDLFGVGYKGRPRAPEKRPALDTNFAVTVDEAYWRERVGVATLTWGTHDLVRDARLAELVPSRSVTFRGPLVAVGDPKDGEVVWRMTPEGGAALPGAVARRVGKGRVVYLACAVDAALWSYAYPYQRRLLARALEWAADTPPPVAVSAPMCVQAGYFTRGEGEARQVVVHLFNGVVTAAHHGLPASEVPLREEVIPVAGVKVWFRGQPPKRIRLEPVGKLLSPHKTGEGQTTVEVPSLDLQALVVAEW